MIQPTTGAQAPTKLVLSIAEASEVLAVSDDLIYEADGTDRTAVPPARSVEVIPTVAIKAVIEGSLEGFPIGQTQ